MLTNQPGHQQGLRNVPITLLSSDRAGGKKADWEMKHLYLYMGISYVCVCVFFFFIIFWMCRSVIIHLLVLVAKSWLRLEILRRGRSWRGINWHQLVKQTSKQDSIWSAPSEWEPGEVWKVLLNAPNLASLWDWRYKSGRELMGLSTCKL